MQLFEELKRRNVFRVALAYLVIAWFLMQVIELLSDILELPAWTPKLVLLLLGMGFIIALIISWAYEITPEGIKKERDVDRSQSITNITAKKLDKITIVLLLLVLTTVAFNRYYHPVTNTPNEELTLSDKNSNNVAESNHDATSEAAQNSPENINSNAIAILPFANRSNKEDDKFFTDGIHDDLLTLVSRIHDLKVISRTSVMKYRNSDKTIPEIAKELGVNAILEGGIQRAGERIRVNVQLIDAKTDQHLWAEIYDHTLTIDNLFAIQSQITEAISTALKTHLSTEEIKQIASAPTKSLEAYDLYLLGRQYFHQRTATSLPKAIDLFEKAIEIDSDFALAYSGLADSYSLIFQYGNFDPETAIPKSYENAQKAVELAPELAESWASLGLINAIQQNHEDSIKHVKKAIEINPNYSMAYVWLGNFYANHRQYRKALETFEKNFELDPAHPLVIENLIDMYITLGDLENAEKFIRRSLIIDPSFVLTYPQIIRFYEEQGDLFNAYRVARRAYSIAPDSPVIISQVINLESILGNNEAARVLLKKMKEIAPRSQANIFNEILLNFMENQSDDEILNTFNRLKETIKAPVPITFMDQLSAFIYLRSGDTQKSLEIIPKDVKFPFLKFMNHLIASLIHKENNDHKNHEKFLSKAREIANLELAQGSKDDYALLEIALVHAAADDFDLSFSYLDKAYRQGLRSQGFMAFWPTFDYIYSKEPSAKQQFESFKQFILDDIELQKQLVAKASQQCNLTPSDCPLDQFPIQY